MQLQSKQGKGDWADRQPPEVTQESVPHCLLRKASLSPCTMPACFDWGAEQIQETHLYGLHDIFLFLGIALLCSERPWMCRTIVCTSAPAKQGYLHSWVCCSPLPNVQDGGWSVCLHAGAPFWQENSLLHHIWETGGTDWSSSSVSRKEQGAEVERRPLTITYHFSTAWCVFVIPCHIAWHYSYCSPVPI